MHLPCLLSYRLRQSLSANHRRAIMTLTKRNAGTTPARRCCHVLLPLSLLIILSNTAFFCYAASATKAEPIQAPDSLSPVLAAAETLPSGSSNEEYSRDWIEGAARYVETPMQRTDWNYSDYVIWSLMIVQAFLIYVLLRNRAKYKATRSLLKRSQLELEHRVAERTDKLRAINDKLYDVIAKHEKTEELLKASQEYVHCVINSMPSIIVGLTPQGAITQWNASAEQATGVDAHDALGQLVHDVYPNLPIKVETIQEALDQNMAKVLENIQHDNDRYIDISVYPLVSTKLSGAVLRIDDVTLRVELENMMIQTEKMMSLGELAAGTAHEINNPLSAIIQSVQNIRRRLSDKMAKNVEVADALHLELSVLNAYLDQREILHFLDNIQEAGERASHIVRNMLEFSRADSSNHSFVDIVNLLENSLELASDSFKLDIGIQFDHICIVKQFAPNMPQVNCSPAEIQQVVLNLLRNASQAFSKGPSPDYEPTITLIADFDGDNAIIEIADNGPGISDTAKRHIFEPFFTTKDVDKGTGLGLSVSYFIITEHHGGAIEVDSTLNQGAHFIIRLPLHGPSSH